MQWVLDRLAARVEGGPTLLLVALLVVSAALVLPATQLETDTDISTFSPDTELAERFERVEQLGALGGSVQVVVDAGDDGDVLSAEGVRLATRIREALRGDDELADRLADGTALAPAVTTWADPVVRALEAVGADPADLEGGARAELLGAAFDAPGAAEATRLLSADPGEAPSAGLAVVDLAPGLGEEERREAALAVRDAVRDAADGSDLAVHAFSRDILQEELGSFLLDEMPMLSLIGLVVVVAILGLAYRSVVDVGLTLGGLVLSLVWMAGLIVLLGPRYLGLTGEFTQIGVAVPVMLVGLGVDYAIHLTTRYREERAQGAGAGGAAGTAVRTVGRALVLVTLTTVIGFLANLVSPLPPIRDFAVFVAVGVTSAMVVMGVLVPTVRSLVDRRRDGDGDGDGGHVPGRLVAAMAALARVAARAPVAVLAACLVVAAAGAVAALDLDTEFSQEAFLPDDSRAAEVLATTRDRFGGDVSEQTFVLVEGDLTDPVVANAVLDATDRLAEVPDVATTGDGAAARSAPGVARRVADIADQLGDVPDDALPEGFAGIEEVAADLAALGWAGERFRPDADVGAVYDRLAEVAPLDQLLGPDRRVGLLVVETRAGEDGAEALAADVRRAVAPIAEAGAGFGVTSEALLARETLTSLAESQAEKIGFTVAAALVVLVAFFGLRRRRPVLGVITLVPTLIALPAVLGVMWLLGLSFNALTATITSIAIGFGVDYGIHIGNRFLEDRDQHDDAAAAVTDTVTHTGAALVASAATTAAAFAVLLLSDLTPLRQFGGVTALTLVLAVVATLLAETSCLVLWDRHHAGRADGGDGDVGAAGHAAEAGDAREPSRSSAGS